MARPRQDAMWWIGSAAMLISLAIVFAAGGLAVAWGAAMSVALFLGFICACELSRDAGRARRQRKTQDRT